MLRLVGLHATRCLTGRGIPRDKTVCLGYFTLLGAQSSYRTHKSIGGLWQKLERTAALRVSAAGRRGSSCFTTCDVTQALWDPLPTPPWTLVGQSETCPTTAVPSPTVKEEKQGLVHRKKLSRVNTLALAPHEPRSPQCIAFRTVETP